ncbi:transmembrane protein 17 isoform X1 [Leptinotarsa decemlineata]|uniref:transmembrane protein 17 isoform X1 n=2 Tax=Leptinotarsa decemlineata TaxID=7539 RepID=UPI003D3073F5
MPRKRQVTNTSHDFPGYQNMTETEVLSNLPLQMALYFNVVFAPVWVIITILLLERNYQSYEELNKYVTVTIIATIFFVEILRLFLGYEGNLKDKIPELAGFWMLSLLLQLPMQGYLLFNPHSRMYILEIVVQSIMFILLIIQLVAGYWAMKYTAVQQTNYYKLQNSQKTSNKQSETVNDD